MGSPQLGVYQAPVCRKFMAPRVGGSNLQTASSQCLPQAHLHGRNKACYLNQHKLDGQLVRLGPFKPTYGFFFIGPSTWPCKSR